MNLANALTGRLNGHTSYDWVIDTARRSEYIVADNVLEYIWDIWYPNTYDLNRDSWSKNSNPLNFPNVAPPFQQFLVGFNNFPKIIGEVDRGSLFYHYRSCAFGVQCMAYEITNRLPKEYIDVLTMLNTNRAKLHAEGVRWMMFFFPFWVWKKTKSIEPPYMSFMMLVKDDGKPYKFGMEYDGDLLEEFVKQNNATKEEVTQDWRETYEPFIYSTLTALTMIHCRNVDLVESKPFSSIGKRHTFKKKQKSNKVTFRTIKISDTLKRVLDQEGQIHKVGVQSALHTCRGHFKDYRHGSGLFGKHQDIYWFNEHKRGDADYGRIIKDYKL